ncbi:MAG: cytochrome c3 family protein [Chloroflexi bacterium]|nr:cytochrome c3 family protein [Chloroflexota bacterium]
MNRPSLVLLQAGIVATAAIAVSIGIARLVFAVAAPQLPDTEPSTPAASDADCLNCHKSKDLKVKLTSGEVLSLYVDSDLIASSVHAGRLYCTDCHRDVTGVPHPTLQASTTRSYTASQYDVCKRCHFSNYTKTMDSVHYQRLAEGDQSAPVCSDCHSAHNTTPPDVPRAVISQTCAKCHAAIYDVYAKSIHGAALLTQGNPDVPVCTNCHQVHNIQNPLTSEFRLQSVQVCSTCHSNKEMMDKYGTSTAVTSTYLRSFHGMSVFLRTERSEGNVPEPVCTDCHGVHDIQAATSPNSPVMKANLTGTCAKCHTGATPNFPDSWLGHYEPSIEHAPAVLAIRWFYRLLIPFIIGGLLVHILLDLWRVITNR